MKERRIKPSKGVVIFSSLIILLGAVNFLFIIISFFQLRLELQFKDYMPSMFSHMPFSTINFTAFWLSTIISLFIMFSWIVSGVGMIFLKEWARQLLLVSIGIYFLNKVIDIVINIAIVNEYSGKLPIIPLSIGIVFVLALTVSITHFFTHPSVVKQFEKSRKSFQ
ncbi:MAG: hypothetical protein PHG69_01365 [Candidatus Omnitrophica bacterium]|nr:hypothetical protein [Candidatus Omnitrophota bacterium]